MEKRKVDFRLAAIDESLYWNDDILDRVEDRKIYGVYLIDVQEYTYCCEITPSYCAYFLYSSCSPKDIDSDIWDLIDEADMNTEPVSYFHVSGMNEFIHCFDEKEIDRDEYDQYLEDMIEDCKGNHYWG